MKHFNKAHVWGKIKSSTNRKTAGGGDFVQAVIDCSHDVFGNVSILCKIWGAGPVKAFGAFHGGYKTGSNFRGSGNIQQFKQGDDTRYGFNIYNLMSETITEKKATFILCGEVVSFKADELLINIKLPAGKNYDAKEEEINIYVPPELPLQLAADFAPGKDITVKGYIVKEKEDEFGEATTPQRPVGHYIEYEGEKVER